MARRDGIDVDAAARQFDGEFAHEPDDACLCCRIMYVLVPTIGDAHDRRERHDGSGSSGDHAGKRWPHDVEDSLAVDIECVLPGFICQGGKRDSMGNASIGDDDVDAAETRLSLRHDGRGLRRVGDVEGAEVRGAARGADHLHSSLTFRVQHVRHGDVMASFGKCYCRCPSDAVWSSRPFMRPCRPTGQPR